MSFCFIFGHFAKSLHGNQLKWTQTHLQMSQYSCSELDGLFIQKKLITFQHLDYCTHCTAISIQIDISSRVDQTLCCAALPILKRIKIWTEENLCVCQVCTFGSVVSPPPRLDITLPFLSSQPCMYSLSFKLKVPVENKSVKLNFLVYQSYTVRAWCVISE